MKRVPIIDPGQLGWPIARFLSVDLKLAHDSFASFPCRGVPRGAILLTGDKECNENCGQEDHSANPEASPTLFLFHAGSI